MTCDSNTVLVDKMLGNSYQTVRFVARQIEYVKHVSAHMAEVYRLAQSIEAVDEVTSQIGKLEALHADLVKILVVADEVENLAAIGQNIGAVAAVNDKLTELLVVYSQIDMIEGVGSEITKIAAVANSIASINAVYAKLAELQFIHDNLTDILDEVSAIVTYNTRLTAAETRLTELASEEQAEEGTDNTAFMTPLRVKQALEALLPSSEIGRNVLSAPNLEALMLFLAPFVGDTGTGGKAGLAPAPNAGDAALGKVLGASGGWVLLSGGGFAPPQGRLTPVSGIAVPSTSIASATSVFYTPSGGRFAPIMDGGQLVMQPFAEEELVLSPTYHSANTTFDVFLFKVGDDVKIGSVAAPAATKILGGIAVNDGPLNLRWGPGAGDVTAIADATATWLGSFRTTVAGETALSDAQVFIANLYNRVPNAFSVREATSSWLYQSGVWRHVRGGAGPKIGFLQVSPGSTIKGNWLVTCAPQPGGTLLSAIGLDTASPLDPASGSNFGATSVPFAYNTCRVALRPSRGFHELLALEYGPNPGGTYFGGAVLSLELDQ